MISIDSLRDKNIHVVGLCGAETNEIARYLHRAGCLKLTLHDFNGPNEFKRVFDISHVSYKKDERERILKETLSIPAVRHYKEGYLSDIMTADIIFVSQNWFNYGFNKPMLFQARESGIPLVTITELYFSQITVPIIGVTGTNGKTTTSNLIAQILKRAGEVDGRSVLISGNDRYSKQILNEIGALKDGDAVVLEVSNRQLVSLSRSPHIAVITNIARDHIEEHGTFEEYIAVKRKLFSFQTAKDYAVINYDDGIARGFADGIESKVFFYSTSDKVPGSGAYLRDNMIYSVLSGEETKVIDIADLKVKGLHNVQNALAATLAALLSGVPLDIIRDALLDFGGIKNRLEFVREVSGVKFYNDISSTSPHATIAAINSFDAPVILIAGGMDKDMVFDELCDTINKSVKRTFLLPGSATDKMAPHLDSCESAEKLPAAVEKAYALADEGDVIVLSPAAANFFTMYATGKNGFNRTVKRLVKRK